MKRFHKRQTRARVAWCNDILGGDAVCRQHVPRVDMDRANFESFGCDSVNVIYNALHMILSSWRAEYVKRNSDI